MEIALEGRNHALVLLLLCNGYDPNLERRCPFDQALRSRTWALLDLLLEWGADPQRVSVSDLLDTYNSKLVERFRALGVDLTADHEIAYALGYHTSNKPLFGYVKHHLDDPKVQRELDIALAHHASEENEKGVLLCLWAGANPHAPVPSLNYPNLTDDEDGAEREGEAFLGWSAIEEACQKGHAGILERLGPDPAKDNFDELYRSAGSAAVVELLVSCARPNDVGEILRRQLWWFRLDSYSDWTRLDIARSIFRSGARWEVSNPEQIKDVRRALLKLNDSSFVDVMKLLAVDGHCADSILLNLGHTPSMRARMKKVGFIPKAPEETRNYYELRPTRSKEVLAKFGVILPKPTPQLPRVIEIGRWRPHSEEIKLTRAELFDRVWSEAVENLAHGWGLSGHGLGKVCARLQVPVPPRGFWAKIEHGHKVRRPRLPSLKPGEGELVVVHLPPKSGDP